MVTNGADRPRSIIEDKSAEGVAAIIRVQLRFSTKRLALWQRGQHLLDKLDAGESL